MAAASSAAAVVPVDEVLQIQGYLIIWQVEGEKRGSWTDYSNEFAVRLEQSYNENPRGAFIARPGARVDFQYDTHRMIQENTETRGRRQIRRVLEPLTEVQTRDQTRQDIATHNQENWTADNLNRARAGHRAASRSTSASRRTRPPTGSATQRLDV